MYNDVYYWRPVKTGETYEQECAILVEAENGKRTYHQYQYGEWVFVGHAGLFGEGSVIYTHVKDGDHACYVRERRNLTH